MVNYNDQLPAAVSAITIAVDGHSGSGKSTMAKTLASRLGYLFVDTGAMYRAVTLYAMRHEMLLTDTHTVDETALPAAIGQIEITFVTDENGKRCTHLNGENVEAEIRSTAIASWVSQIAALPFVRTRLVALQQAMGQHGGVVMDGRDIGTVVFPHAELKVFVTADLEARAERRLRQNQSKGDMRDTYEVILENLKQRDFTDEHRPVGPLRLTDEYLLLDNTHLTEQQQNDLLFLFAKAAIVAADKTRKKS